MFCSSQTVCTQRAHMEWDISAPPMSLSAVTLPPAGGCCFSCHCYCMCPLCWHSRDIGKVQDFPPLTQQGFCPTHTHTLSSLSFNNVGVLGGQGGMWWEVTEVLSFSIKGKIQSDLKQHSKFIILLCTPV